MNGTTGVIWTSESLCVWVFFYADVCVEGVRRWWYLCAKFGGGGGEGGEGRLAGRGCCAVPEKGEGGISWAMGVVGPG